MNKILKSLIDILKTDSHTTNANRKKKLPRVSHTRQLKDKTIHDGGIIVVLQPNLLAGASMNISHALKRENDIHSDFVYHSAIKGFSIPQIDAHKLSFLLHQSHVLRIEKNHRLHMYTMHTVQNSTRKNTHNQEIQWNILNVHTPIPYDEKQPLKISIPVHLYILDTGISVKHPDLPFLDNSHRRNFVAMEKEIDDDLQGHSSHLAGIAAGINRAGHGILGIAPGIQLHSIKVLDKNGDGNISTCIAGIDYIIQEKLSYPHKDMVANLSLGFDSGTQDYNVLDESIAKAISLGIIFVVAAGNDACNANTFSPAHVKQAITVGSYNSEKEFSSFSNHGDSVDILAPGEEVYSAWKNGDYNVQSGTSQASPHVAAAACLFLFLHPQASPEEVKYFLLAAAKKDKIKNVGQGTPNVSLYLSDDFMQACIRNLRFL